MESVWHVQSLGPDQFAAWKALRNALYSGLDDEAHEREMATIHAAPDQRCFAALDAQRRLVGFIEASLRNIVDGCDAGPIGYIEGLYVTPDARGMGIGGDLVAHAVAWFRQAGCSEMATDAELDDSEAQDYWRKAGFEETWRIVQFRRAL
ncbi:MAG: GNAT family N-acetyltransferase [Nevskiales bacterium]|nr:GNAT family N-acetyltransferase [Nevskiales bacterium]